MTASREELERALLADPFNGKLRAEYAALLLSQADAQAALAQYDIVLKQLPTLAAAHVGRARALLALGRDGDALQAYASAASLPEFVPDELLDARQSKARRAEPSRLSVVQGGRPDNVVDFVNTSRERIRFADIAGLEDLKRTVRLQIIEPFLRPGLFAKFKKRAGGGVMLYGPPGCGKTKLARAVATE